MASDAADKLDGSGVGAARRSDKRCGLTIGLSQQTAGAPTGSGFKGAAARGGGCGGDGLTPRPSLGLASHGGAPSFPLHLPLHGAVEPEVDVVAGGMIWSSWPPASLVRSWRSWLSGLSHR